MRVSNDSTTSNLNYAAAQSLEKLGYKQELPRSRGQLHILFMTLAIMAVPCGLLAPIATSLVGGGPATMVWGWLLVSFLNLTLAMSLGEICSKYPTSAGAYYWCHRLAPPNSKRLSSWITGWLNLVGVWTISLSVVLLVAQLIIAGVGIFHPEWVVKPWQTYLILLAVGVFVSVVIMFFNKILPTLDVLCAVWTALGTVVILVALSAKAGAGRHSATYALSHFDASFSGWTPGWTFFIGLLPPAYTYAGIGMVTSMCEEVHDPSIQVPKALVWSIPIGTISGFLLILPIVFTLPDIAMLLSVPGGQPIGVILTSVMGSKLGGFGIWLILFGIGLFCVISISCAASRSTWTFARDKAIPFSSFFARVSSSNSDDSVPLNAHLLSTTVQLSLGALCLGSSAALNAFVGVGVICLGASYGMPIAMVMWGGRKGVQGAPYGYGEGWLGWVVNAFALLWVLFEMVLFSMPAVIPVTRMSMNYASVVFVGFGVISGAWYLINGRFHYTGPPSVEVSSESLVHEK